MDQLKRLGETEARDTLLAFAIALPHKQAAAGKPGSTRCRIDDSSVNREADVHRSGTNHVISAVVLFCSATAIRADAQTFTTLLNFEASSGGAPYYAPLVQGGDGYFYGTTNLGGTMNAGTVFKMTSGGTPTVLHNFTGGPDGAFPYGGLIQAADGNFYGTTSSGANGGALGTFGTVFQITPGGTLTTLHAFDSTDGANSYAGLVQGSDGDLYGTTVYGGANGAGTVFKITTGGAFTSLYSFNTTDGLNPSAALIQATDGNFYGTTTLSGSSGGGTLFKITSSGTLTTLHNFNVNDGAKPFAPLLQASDGAFYGTTFLGGSHGLGTVFKMTLAGVLTTLYSFANTDGNSPSASLIQAADGNLYGTTAYGGANSLGTLFRITLGGFLTTLHSFTGADGADPLAALVQASDGNFYGTTRGGGTSGSACMFLGCGTAFRLTPPPALSPCDLMGNGTINVADVQLIVNEALGVTPAVHDLNGDGVVNIVDVQIETYAALGLGCAAQ